MTMPAPISAPIAATGAQGIGAALPHQAGDREQLRELAQQFEAIFLRQMLSAANKTDFGGDDLFGSQGEETFTEMRDAHFANVAASSGMVGFARSIEEQLTHYIRAEG